MITVLREIGQHIQHGVVQKSAFKIIYIAPMKALAAEMTATFSKRLAPLGLTVKEWTGDMQLSKKELAETQMIVSTPEKWDVITRKGGEVDISSLVKLLIIDEVHLLNDSRGPVIETIVARTLRQVQLPASFKCLSLQCPAGRSLAEHDSYCWTLCNAAQLQRCCAVPCRESGDWIVLF